MSYVAEWMGLLDLVSPAIDENYEEAFQHLSDVNLDIRNRGATFDLLVRKSILEGVCGNYKAARDDAGDALDYKPLSKEARYQKATSTILLAYAESGALESTNTDLARGVRRLLCYAKSDLQFLANENKNDIESKEMLGKLQALLDEFDTEDEIRAALVKDAGRLLG